MQCSSLTVSFDSSCRNLALRRLIENCSYKPLRCPTGKTPSLSVNLRRQKYFTLPKFGNGVSIAATRPKEEGRIAIVTNAGRVAVGVDDIGATGFAGRETVSETPSRTRPV